MTVKASLGLNGNKGTTGTARPRSLLSPLLLLHHEESKAAVLLNASPLNINAFAALQGILKVCREVLTNAPMAVSIGLEDMSIFIHEESFKI